MNFVGQTNLAARLGAPLVATLLAGAAAALPFAARAADANADLSYICRPAVGSDSVSARTTSVDATPLTCRPLNVALRMSDGSMHVIGRVTAKSNSGPDLRKAVTPDQINDAWAGWVMETFRIDRSS